MNDSSHSHRITGQQARQLLDEATQGPWETGPGMDFMRSRVVFDTVTDGRGFTTSHVLADVTRPGDADLIAAAPALAETIAWLWSELENLRDFADEDFRPSNYAEIATYDPLGAEKLRAAEETVRLVHRQYQRRIHGIFRATEEARP